MTLSPDRTHLALTIQVGNVNGVHMMRLADQVSWELPMDRNGWTLDSAVVLWDKAGQNFMVQNFFYPYPLSSTSAVDSYLGCTTSKDWRRLNGDQDRVLYRGWAEDDSALLTQRVDSGYPPQSEYQVRGPGGSIVQVLVDTFYRTGAHVEWSADSVAYLTTEAYQGGSILPLNQYDEATNTYQRISGAGISVSAFSYSPDGSYLVRVDREYGEAERRLGFSSTSNPTFVSYPYAMVPLSGIALCGWSPGGNKLAFMHTSLNPVSTPRLSIATGQNQFTDVFSEIESGEFIRFVTWSPDGRYLAFAAKKQGSGPVRSLFVYDTLGQGSLVEIPSSIPFANYIYPVWSSDSQTLYATLRDTSAQEFSALEIPMATPTSPTLLSSDVRWGDAPLITHPSKNGVLWVEDDPDNQTETLIYSQPGQLQRPLITATRINQVLHSYVNRADPPGAINQ
ncbi:MAG: hypothetical protein GY930_09455 [bacterium]|nr:hypothetical protein [bacterium]